MEILKLSPKVRFSPTVNVTDSGVWPSLDQRRFQRRRLSHELHRVPDRAATASIGNRIRTDYLADMLSPVHVICGREQGEFAQESPLAQLGTYALTGRRVETRLPKAIHRLASRQSGSSSLFCDGQFQSMTTPFLSSNGEAAWNLSR
jgi:hypothetical protein